MPISRLFMIIFFAIFAINAFFPFAFATILMGAAAAVIAIALIARN